ncbi:MAG: hypothetical protein LBJ95_02225 [Oscillospiraceae bacterium]|nr:hypothetical protein [Oscillospiraceae bacterium]
MSAPMGTSSPLIHGISKVDRSTTASQRASSCAWVVLRDNTTCPFWPGRSVRVFVGVLAVGVACTGKKAPAKPAAKTSDISFLAENFIRSTSFRYNINLKFGSFKHRRGRVSHWEHK